MDKGFLNISFAWFFAIIVGAFIIFLAIYATTKFMEVGQFEVNTKTANTLGILLNPLETSFESATSNSLKLPVETRIYNTCDPGGNFGKQIIQVSQKSFNKWPEPASEVSFPNKYIFSNNTIEGETFFVFSKPFNFPFKVADLMYITPSTKEYCFKNAPDHIEEEIEDINQKNLKIDPDCSSDSSDRIDVCFSSSSTGCEFYVKYGNGYVRDENEGERMFFETDALMYAAIFSNKDIYECQVKRLMLRIEQLTILYTKKANFIRQTSGCTSNVNTYLANLKNKAHNLAVSNSPNLQFDMPFRDLIENIEEKNDGNGECKLW